MAVRADYLVIHRGSIAHLINDILFSVFEYHEIEYDLNQIDNLVAVRYRKPLGTDQFKYISGLSISFEDMSSDSSAVISEFGKRLKDSVDEGVLHVVKLYDETLHEELNRYATELFEIEMKLREALSLIFLDSFTEINSYDMLKSTGVTIQNKQPPNEDYMNSHLENELFYLLYSQYPNLNEPRSPKNVAELLGMIHQADNFKILKGKLFGRPIHEQKYIDFIASLKTIMDPLEKVRNCVAHNRCIPAKLAGNYSTAKSTLMTHINKFLEEFSPVEIEEAESELWEVEALEYLRRILESAKWDFEEGTVTIYEEYDQRISQVCETANELVSGLTQIAEREAYGVIPYEGGEPVWEYDGTDTVLSALAEYEGELKEMGWDDEI